MTFLGKIKCAINNKQSLADFYQGLSREELEARKPYHLKIFITMSLVWGVTFVFTAWGTNMKMPLVLVYLGTVISTIITLWVDYRKKIKLIDKLLQSK